MRTDGLEIAFLHGRLRGDDPLGRIDLEVPAHAVLPGGGAFPSLEGPDRKLDIVGAQHHPFFHQGREPTDEALPPTYALDRPFEKNFLATGRHPDAKGILDHFQMSVPAAEKVGGVDAFVEFDLEEGHLGQARERTPV